MCCEENMVASPSQWGAWGVRAPPPQGEAQSICVHRMFYRTLGSTSLPQKPPVGERMGDLRDWWNSP